MRLHNLSFYSHNRSRTVAGIGRPALILRGRAIAGPRVHNNGNVGLVDAFRTECISRLAGCCPFALNEMVGRRRRRITERRGRPHRRGCISAYRHARGRQRCLHVRSTWRANHRRCAYGPAHHHGEAGPAIAAASARPSARRSMPWGGHRASISDYSAAAAPSGDPLPLRDLDLGAL